MKTVTTELSFPFTATAQLGNRSDTSGYIEAQEVTVLDACSTMGSKETNLFLIEFNEGNRLVIGRATATKLVEGIPSKLYCTTAMSVGSYGKTKQDCIDYLWN